MSPRASKRRELTDEQLARWNELKIEEMGKPIPWFKHDADAHSDPKMARLLVGEHGREYYGLFWLLVEKMAARDGHSYEVGDEAGWIVLAFDLRCNPMIDGEIALVKDFVQTLAKLELINRDRYEEEHVITSERLWRNCAEATRGRASKRLAGEITAAQRWGGKEGEEQ